MFRVGRTLLALFLSPLIRQGSAWQPLSPVAHHATQPHTLSRPQQFRPLKTSGSDYDESDYATEGWSVADDWNAMSSENPLNADTDVFNQDMVQNAAESMKIDDEESKVSEEDVWLGEVIEDILRPPLSSTPLYDTKLSNLELEAMTSTASSSNTATQGRGATMTPEQEQKAFEERMGAEISMLVRCNESPDDMLVDAGRAVPELTLEEKTDVSQLLDWKEGSVDDNEQGHWEPTPFYANAIATIFRKHASTPQGDDDDKVPTMDAKAVSRWMTQSMGDDLDSYTTRGRSSSKPRTGKDMTSDPSDHRQKISVKIGPHDSRVLKLLSKYANYGSGKLTLENFQQIYMDPLTHLPNGMKVIQKSGNSKGGVAEDLQVLLLRNADHIRQVWRDLRNHGIVGPNEQEWNKKRVKLEAEYGSTLQTQSPQQEDFVDECEILDLAYEPPPTEQQVQSGHDEKNHKYIRKSSYERVQLAPDGKTPLYMDEGDFVFIDEESCIGCMQCVTAAPASYLMLENGRARTFHQRKGPDVRQGVAACPVNCMHFVSYDELKELETVRDKGDGRDDHRHMGHRRGHTPLYVAGIDSDNNHRSSWYHHIKNKCCTSGQCPQRGCFDCPSYRASGENPFFQKKAKEAQHTRARHFLDRGDVDLWRKTADL